MCYNVNMNNKEETFNVNNVSASSLAFLGDAVFSLCIREYFVKKCLGKSGKLHEMCSKFVSASGQSDILKRLMPMLSEEEKAVVKTGRNTFTKSKAKGATLNSYKKSTGFEALLGYLHLLNRKERIEEIIALCLSKTTNAD